LPARSRSPWSTERISAGASCSSRRKAAWMVAISAPSPTAVVVDVGVATLVMVTLLGRGRAGRAVGGLHGVADTRFTPRSPGAAIVGPNGHSAGGPAQPRTADCHPGQCALSRRFRARDLS